QDVDGDGDLDLVLHFRTQETNLRQVYERLLAEDVDADGVLDSTRQEAQVSLPGRTVNDLFFEGLDAVDLFLSGKALRDFLSDLAARSDLTDTGTGLLSRLNGDYFLLDGGSGQTVFNDSSSDTLTGSAGSDWFFAGTADRITDLSALDQAFVFG